MEMKKTERYCEYHIAISGDDYAAGNIVLSDSEAEVVKKVLNCLVPLGQYAPEVYFVNMDDAKKKTEECKKQVAEERKKQLDHAMGLDVKFKTAMEIAFEKAMEKSESQFKTDMHFAEKDRKTSDIQFETDIHLALKKQ